MKNLINQFLVVAILAGTFLANISCTSFFGKSGRKGDLADVDLDNLPSSRREEPIVYQANNRQAIVAKFDRKYWVNLRGKMKASENKLMATLATGEWDVAESDARLYLRHNPQNATAITVISLSLAMQRKYQLAAFYAGLLEKYGQATSDMLNVKGLAYLVMPKATMQDYRKAQQYFHDAFYGHDNEIAAGLNLGNLFLELGDAQGASDVFDKLQGRCGGCVQSLIGSGIAYTRLKNYERAEDSFERVLKKRPNHAQSLYRLALIAHYGSNKKNKARELLQQLLAKSNVGEIRQKAQSLLRSIESMDEEDRSGKMIAQDPDAKKIFPVKKAAKKDKSVETADEDLPNLSPDADHEREPQIDAIPGEKLIETNYDH